MEGTVKLHVLNRKIDTSALDSTMREQIPVKLEVKGYVTTFEYNRRFEDTCIEITLTEDFKLSFEQKVTTTKTIEV